MKNYRIEKRTDKDGNEYVKVIMEEPSKKTKPNKPFNKLKE